MHVANNIATIVGVTCVASAALLAAEPEASTHTLGMPSSRVLGRALALRDLAIGALLLRRSSRAPGLVLRQVSDAFDAGLAVASLTRGRRGVAPFVTVAGALALSAGAWWLRRMQEP